ncbi:PIN domain-containing protein [Chlamydoabsidia padenii]|nr:PIN domain-containing protein [Chlamydoabsidia padenii]
MDSLMDIDGPDFILEVNEAIAAVRLKKTGETCETFSQQTAIAFCFQKVAVVDTNFLISNLSYLIQLLQQAEQQQDSLLIVIPWTVVLELDGLKNSQRVSNSTDRLGDLARKATRFLEATFQRKSPALRGQRSDETFDRESSQKVMGDDRILDCCLYFRYHLEKPVLLLSNDRNLSIKAMIHHIDALSAESKSRMTELLDLVSKGQKGMLIDPSFTKGSEYIIDEDEDMMDIEDNNNHPKEHNVPLSGTSLSRYAGTIPTTIERPQSTIPSRAHWYNEYYRQGLDLKKK